MRDLLIVLVFLAYICVGTLVPFVAALGYVWVDVFIPQWAGYGLLSAVPVSLIMAVVTIGAYAVLDRRVMPRPGLHLVLTLVMFVWVTVTLSWAVVPDAAWGKWNWAAKTVAFSAFIPFFFRSRVQIEAFLLTWLFAAVIHIVPVGLKTMVSGGGYGYALGVIGGNSLLSEGSTLATVCAMWLPLLMWVRRHAMLVPLRLRTPGCLGYAAAAGAAAIGTYERTAIVALAVSGLGMLIRSKRKALAAALIGVALVGGGAITGSQWAARMETTENYSNDNSALTRLAMWKWTLNFVSANPQGGGFEAYHISKIETQLADGSTITQFGRAFHNSFFEVLGEQGWFGLAVFLGLCAKTMLSLQRVRKQTRDVEAFLWARDLANALQIALLTAMAGGFFVGIAFQPMFWYVFAAGECVRQHVMRAALGGVAQPAVPGMGTAGGLAPAPLA
jgi:probable O-glycosylation ligase (exosortase A-associated)